MASDGRGSELPGWSCTGLSRSYSEHAALVLEHLARARQPERAKCTRSGPTLPSGGPGAEGPEERDGQRTWRASSSEQSWLLELGAGDVGGLAADFSGLSLRPDSELGLEADFSSTRSFNEYEDDCESFCLAGEEEGAGDFELARPFAEEQEGEEDGCEGRQSASSSRSRATRLSGQLSYEDWAREKRLERQRRREEARRAEERRREAEAAEMRAREEKERRDYECLLDWTRRKEKEKALKRQMLAKELELQRKIRDVEEMAKSAKDACLKNWHKSKEEEGFLARLASEKEESMKRKKADEEKQAKLQKRLKAYEQWRERAKSAPRPATQGLLPHQKAKPAFTNPTPWQPLVEYPSDDSDHGLSTKSPVRSKKLAIKRLQSRRSQQ